MAQPGDIWILGEHRLLCGNSTVAADVARVMGGDALQRTGVITATLRAPVWRR